MKGPISIRITMSEETNELLKKRADILGITTTQLAKHLILQELNRLEGPVEASLYKSDNLSIIELEKAELQRLIDIVTRVKARLVFQQSLRKNKYNF